MKPGADWLAWILQFAAGSVAGLLLGLAMLGNRSGQRSLWLGTDLIPMFLTGWALVGAGLAHGCGRRWTAGRQGHPAPLRVLTHPSN